MMISRVIMSSAVITVEYLMLTANQETVLTNCIHIVSLWELSRNYPGDNFVFLSLSRYCDLLGNRPLWNTFNFRLQRYNLYDMANSSAGGLFRHTQKQILNAFLFSVLPLRFIYFLSGLQRRQCTKINQLSNFTPIVLSEILYVLVNIQLKCIILETLLKISQIIFRVGK